MNFQFYFEKLKNSEEFKKFIEENPKAFLCSAFFSIDKTGNDNQQHFDFFNDKIFSFQLESNCRKVPLENYGDKIPTQVSSDHDFEFKDIEDIIGGKIKKEGIKNEIQKILLSLQNIEGMDYLVGTVFISGLGMIKIKIDPDKMLLTDFEKKSFFDMIKVLKK